MRAACVAFVAGALALQQQPTLPAAETSAVAGITIVVVAFVVARLLARVHAPLSIGTGEHRTARRLRVAAKNAISTVAAIAAGFCWAAWRADARLADELPHALEGRDVVVIGTIAVLPSIDPRGTRFEFTVESVASRDERGRPLAVPAHLALGWYRPMRAAPGSSTGVPDLRPGQRWRLTVRLKRPHGSANPYGFDYEYWLLEEGLRATGYVRPGVDPGDVEPAEDEASEPEPESSASTRKLDDFVWSLGHVVERARAHLRDRVLTVLADGGPIHVNAPYAGVIVALIVGDQRAIAQWLSTIKSYRGLSHETGESQQTD